MTAVWAVNKAYEIYITYNIKMLYFLIKDVDVMFNLIKISVIALNKKPI